MILQSLEEKKLILPPKWLSSTTQYLTIMGSNAYGTASDNSDLDIYGWCVPPKDHVFPHLNGEILGFGRQKKRFEQWQQHHVYDEHAAGGKGTEYDFQVCGIVKFFQLVMDNNPNWIDSMFVRSEHIIHITDIGNLVRDNRHIFLHKGCWPKFKGYSYSQQNKMSKSRASGKRVAVIEEFGYDVKFAAHCLRLLLEVEQILAEGDLDLMRHREQIKSVRRGEWKEEDIRKWAADKEKQLEKLYHDSKLPWGPDETKIKGLLLRCLEAHFGSLDKCIANTGREADALRQIQEICEKYT